MMQFQNVIDAGDLGKTSGYETMLVIGSANGTGITWNVVRGIEGTTPKAHAANWVCVPAPTAPGLAAGLQAFQDSGRPTGRWWGRLGAPGCPPQCHPHADHRRCHR